MNTAIGVVIHYFDKIGVAIVSVTKKSLHTGDEIKFTGHDHEFNQKIDSMQRDHQQIKLAKKGAEVGIKVSQKVKEHDQVFLSS